MQTIEKDLNINLREFNYDATPLNFKRIFKPYKPIFIEICFCENVFSHSFHLFSPFQKVIFRMSFGIKFVEFFTKQSFYFVLIPSTISVKILKKNINII